jgi:hypothetical protein
MRLDYLTWDFRRDIHQELNPDSAVAIDRKREAQPFRSEVDRFLPLSKHRSAVLRGDIKPYSNDVR